MANFEVPPSSPMCVMCHRLLYGPQAIFRQALLLRRVLWTWTTVPSDHRSRILLAIRVNFYRFMSMCMLRRRVALIFLRLKSDFMQPRMRH